MGLFGALFAGVAGLGSQSNKIGIVSNNISNVNTVGYKQGSADFDTLVVPGASTGLFSPGGVLGNNRQLVDQQGLIQATTSNTDIAISGGGFFVVNTKPDGTGDTEYTRAGSFTPDASGNFKNSAGLYLMGVPLTGSNSSGTVSLNAGVLKTVNVNQNATGSSVATTQVTITGNLNASQKPLAGAGEIATLKGESTLNSSSSATDIIIPEGTAGNNLKVGDSFTVTTGTTGNGSPTVDTYTYGGFDIGRNVATGAVGNSGTALVEDTGGPLTATDTTHIKITVPTGDAAAYVVGQKVYLSGLTSGVGTGITAAQLNGQSLTISAVNTTTGQVTLTLPSGVTATAAGDTGGGTAIGITNRTYEFKSNILDASSESALLLQDSASHVTTASKTFSITVQGTAYNFTYNAVPNTSSGQFNSLDSLATSITNSSNGALTASVKNNQLYVSATNPDNGVTYTNGDDVGSTDASGNFVSGINWVQELGLQNTTTNTPQVSGIHYFNSLQSLANQVNSVDPTHTIATVANGTVSINAVDPQVNITFDDLATQNTTATAKQGGSILKALGFLNANGSPLPTTGTVLSTGALNPTYVATDPAKNMSSGNVVPQFTKDVTVYDSLGVSHTVAMNVVKLSSLKWAVELTAVPAGDVISANTANGQPATDGMIASGTLTFDGSGNLVDSQGFGFGSATSGTSGATPITVQWAQSANSPGAGSSQITFNFGDQNTSDGLGQYAGASNVTQAIQDGAPTGQLTGVSIDSNGFVTASFSNGQTQKLYQIPLASVNNANGLESISGNAYKQTLASGEVTLAYAGTNGVGTIAASALEQSNVDLSTQLTDLIVAQQAYGANTRVLTVTSQLLQQLNQIIQ